MPDSAPHGTGLSAATVGRAEIEEFLFHEAALLDEWQLDDWITLFTDDARYMVPALDSAPDAQPEESLFYIADNRHRLEQRVIRLNKRTAHAEFPHSKCCRLINNVRIVERGPDTLEVRCKFVTYRTKNEITDTFMGEHRHAMVVTEEGLRIREKRTVLALDALRPQGKISIIL